MCLSDKQAVTKPKKYRVTVVIEDKTFHLSGEARDYNDARFKALRELQSRMITTAITLGE